VEAVLAETLSQVAGAGQVSVRVFLDSGPRYEYARKTADDTRTTQESDRSGTSRITSERREEGEVTVRRGGSGGEDVPVVVMTHLPAVRGVLVVAGGAADPTVRAELSRAVQTALGLPPHRVTVLAKEAEE
jgi:stage III sporulation protein AG